MDKSKVLKKIAALLARGDAEQNDNEHEREISMRHAQKLMDEYNISVLEASVGQLGDTAREQDGIWIPNASKWKRMVYGALGRLYGVTAYNDGDNMIYLVGTEANREVTTSMGEYVIDSIEREAKTHSSKGRKFVGSFKKGAMSGVSASISVLVRERETQPEGEGKGLVLASFYTQEMTRNDQWLADTLNIHLRSSRVKGSASSKEGLQAGHEHGSSISLNNQIASGAGQKLLG